MANSYKVTAPKADSKTGAFADSVLKLSCVLDGVVKIDDGYKAKKQAVLSAYGDFTTALTTLDSKVGEFEKAVKAKSGSNLNNSVDKVQALSARLKKNAESKTNIMNKWVTQAINQQEKDLVSNVLEILIKNLDVSSLDAESQATLEKFIGGDL